MRWKSPAFRSNRMPTRFTTTSAPATARATDASSVTEAETGTTCPTPPSVRSLPAFSVSRPAMRTM